MDEIAKTRSTARFLELLMTKIEHLDEEKMVDVPRRLYRSKIVGVGVYRRQALCK